VCEAVASEAATEKFSLKPSGEENKRTIQRDRMHRRIDRNICLGTHRGGEEVSRNPRRDVSMPTFISKSKREEEGTVHVWIEIHDNSLPRKCRFHRFPTSLGANESRCLLIAAVVLCTKRIDEIEKIDAEKYRCGIMK